ncbi:hypothetical protein Goshw_023566 [Gossypium schwendimanii]|uniref:Uncharacterized protein n=1 Tax=Gossypium schwendimanii TaxID=34291 RepID=A0A7J9N399_GOSSC|nr:hypothetical protein [Gossypium schwendimanii]
MYSPELNSARRSLSWVRIRESAGSVEDNAAIPIWSEKTQQEKGDSLTKGYMSELWDFTRISVTQNNLQGLKEIWDQWDDETKQSLNACQRAGEKRFIECAQLLLTWFHSHFWKVEKVSYQVFSENYSPLKELVATLRRDDISEEKWMAILQSLQDDDVE